MLTSPMNVAAVIPAYQPEAALVDLVCEVSRAPFRSVIVVDDGSDPEHQEPFDTIRRLPNVQVVRHQANLGKGAALKTGIAKALAALPDCTGIVTADADGQHHADDIVRVAQALVDRPTALILGVRRFDGDVPLRSSVGNRVTRAVLRIVLGQRLSDTQTGLRAIPRGLAGELLKIGSTGYEFELDMLIAAKHHRIRVDEVPIRTIYLADNRTSHFNPLQDSMRISFVLLRFTGLSLATAILDNLVFSAVFRAGAGLFRAQAAGRLIAVLFNYPAARRAVFLSREPHRKTLPKYLALVAVSGAAAYWLIGRLAPELGVPVAKVAAETLLFLFNFVMQRDFVFVKSRPLTTATDWDGYYAGTPATARLTRRYTEQCLIRMMRRCGDLNTLVELGGANSCFFDAIRRELRPNAYHLVDNNRYGLDLLRARAGATRGVELHCQDVLRLSLDLQADLVFSVGLIEHFDPERTRRIIHTHFDLLRPGGYAVISFPTPTMLYRVARWITEGVGLWKFPDERPLAREEVAAAIGDRAEIVEEKLLWPLVFTQRMMLARKGA